MPARSVPREAETRIMRTTLIVIVVAIAALITPVATAAPQPPYQQYLIPNVANDVPGAFGSIWRSELALFNTGAMQHSIVGPFCDPASTTCNSTLVLDPSAGAIPVLVPQYAGTDGAFLYVSLPTSDIASEFRVSDLSRQSQTWGTELPLVPTAQFRDHVDLLNIPTDSRYRLTLRIYSTGVAEARVHTIAFPSQAELAVQDVPLTTPPTLSQGLNLSPAYARMTLPLITTADRIRLKIDQILAGGSPIFAFLTVTNNDTQQVTAITPQPTQIGTALPNGHWASSGMCFDNDGAAAKVIYGCSSGNFPPPVVLGGEFDTDGTWTTSIGPAVTTIPAHLSGTVNGESLIVTIRTGTGVIGPVTVQLGNQGPCGATCP